MMPLIENKKIKQTLLASALLFIMPLAQAWVTPVNMDTDHEGDGTTFHRLSKIVDGVTVDLDRCDTDSGIYATAPTQCHHRNLVWQLGSKNGDNVAQPLAQWNPELGDDANWRLPTIKELSRLMDYSSLTAAEGALTGQPLIINMFPSGLIPSSGWLISSTHRDIDGDETNGQAQIFGINMGNGEIAAFDTVISADVNPAASSEELDQVFSENWGVQLGDGHEFSRTESIVDDNKIEVIELVTSSVDNMDVEGTFTITGNRITNVYPISLKKCDSLDVNGVCTTTDVDVYALLVYKDTVNDL